MQAVDPRQISPQYFTSPSAYASGGVNNGGNVPSLGFASVAPPTKMAVHAESSSFGSIVNTVKEIVSMVVRIVEMVATLIGGTFKGSPQHGGVMSSSGAIVSGGANENKGSGGIFDKITPYISKGVSVAKELFNLFSPEDKAKDAAETAAAAGGKESGGIFDSVKSLGSSIWGGIKSVGSSIWDGIKGIGSFFGSLF